VDVQPASRRLKARHPKNPRRIGFHDLKEGAPGNPYPGIFAAPKTSRRCESGQMVSQQLAGDKEVVVWWIPVRE
jgi:hypothetical protein